MSSVLEFQPELSQVSQLRQGRVLDLTEGADVRVELVGRTQIVDCQVLHTGSPGLSLSKGDVVLVWLQDPAGGTGVVLGRTGSYTPPAETGVAQDAFVGRQQTLVLEAEGDVILRNRQARIKLGADGDVEIVCASFTTRSHRLLRLLAPLIKLN
jgi:hypothetical protein